MLPKFDEIPSCLFKVLKKNQNVVDKELQRAIINVDLVDINVFAKSDENSVIACSS